MAVPLGMPQTPDGQPQGAVPTIGEAEFETSKSVIPDRAWYNMEFIKEWQPLISVGIAIIFLLWKFPTKDDLKAVKDQMAREHDKLYKEVVNLRERIDRRLEFHSENRNNLHSDETRLGGGEEHSL